MEDHEPDASKRAALHPGAIFAVALLLALALYVLSAMPLFFALNRAHAGTPSAVYRFYSPINWAAQNTALRGPIYRYGRFVSRLGR